jgi:hypothetical protein
VSGPLFLIENLLSTIAFPGHSLVGDSEPAGFEGWRVADGRRDPADYWGPSGANAQHTLTLSCDRPRAADTFVLDRGHNLAGYEVVCECSDDNFGTTQTVFDTVLPTASSPTALSDAQGCRTEEGAWIRNFPDRAATYWRLRIPAMGVGLSPIVVGAWLGLSWTLGGNPWLKTPWGEDTDEIRPVETTSEWGWRGRGPTNPVRTTTAAFNLATDGDYDAARYVRGHLAVNRPMWVCFDQAQGDRTWLALRQVGAEGIEFRPGWFPRQGQFALVEHEPLRVS